MSRTAKLVVAGAAIAAVVAAAIWLPVGEWLQAAVAWTRDLGAAGVVAFSIVFVVVCLALLPSIELYIAAGLLYGTWWGALLTAGLGVVVELCTVWLVRTRVRERVERRIRRDRRLKALDRAVSSSFWIVVLLRFSPIVPFGLLNYALATTKMPVRRRVAANALGMFPNCLFQAYLGSLLSGIGQLADADAHTPSAWKYIALVAGVASTIGAAVLTAWAMKRSLARPHRRHA